MKSDRTTGGEPVYAASADSVARNRDPSALPRYVAGRTVLPEPLVAKQESVHLKSSYTPRESAARMVEVMKLRG